MRFLILLLLINFSFCVVQKFNLKSVYDEIQARANENPSEVSFDLLRTTNRKCVEETLNLVNFNPELPFEDAVVGIYSAAFYCKPDLNDYLNELFNKTLKSLKSENHTENLDCYKLAVLEFDPYSRLIQGFNAESVTKPNCKEIAMNAREEALRGATAAFGGFFESTYGPDGQENKAIMYKLIILANGDYSSEIIDIAKARYKNDFIEKSKKRIQKILSMRE